MAALPPVNSGDFKSVGALGSALLFLLASCSGGSTSLVVDVRSDFVPGVEAVEVDVVVETLPGATRIRRALNVGDDLVRGVRAATVGPVPAGSHIVRATLLGRSGEELLSRRVAVEARGITGVIVALTRNCSGVSCPAVGGDLAATECQDGLCVPPACAGGSCSVAECATASECAPPSSVCAEARCVEGVCLNVARIGACDAGSICVEGSGCVSVPGDAGTPDAAVDAGCSGECSPGQVEEGACGVCGTRTRSCGADCTWRGFSACADDDARCTDPAAPECVNDYCWGWTPLDQAALSCVDMSRDYLPGSFLGSLAEDIVGRPGARWSKENRQSSCAGSAFTAAPSEQGVLDAAGRAHFQAEYGASACDLSVLGRWESRIRITDSDGSSFLLANVEETIFHNASCGADRSSCGAASSFCPPPACSGACSPGETQTSNCGVCGTRTHSCNADCTWGAYSACADTDARCTDASAPECINDYCWGARVVSQSALSCLDMSRDYQPASASLGTLGQDIFGRPGATWMKQSQQTSCAGSSYADGESGTIPAGGSDSFRFTYGASTCTNTILGRWRSRFRIVDTDGSSFFLSATPEITIYNASCTADRGSCSAVSTYCP